MRAILRSARIAPKKANVIAGMVRGLPVEEALSKLLRMHKKGARMVEKALQSAVANAEHNEKQHSTSLYVREVIVNQGSSYRRGVSMARGRVRPIRKFLSHISIVLGVQEGEQPKEPKQTKNSKKQQSITSAKSQSPVQSSRTSTKKGETKEASSVSSHSAGSHSTVSGTASGPAAESSVASS